MNIIHRFANYKLAIHLSNIFATYIERTVRNAKEYVKTGWDYAAARKIEGVG